MWHKEIFSIGDSWHDTYLNTAEGPRFTSYEQLVDYNEDLDECIRRLQNEKYIIEKINAKKG